MQASKYAPKEFIPTHTNIHRIECPKSWKQLTLKEQLYAYYLTRASWEGSIVTWFQNSYESPALLVLLKLVFNENLETLRGKVLQAGLTD